eukprot:GFKZ01002256.1.p1 GENE.GFKZ01002256.1~~GFKZ01002256.1.p1  ORF type:complete len:145 (-),score=15.07 GFKZ01002256.1:208-642(-)
MQEVRTRKPPREQVQLTATKGQHEEKVVRPSTLLSVVPITRSHPLGPYVGRPSSTLFPIKSPNSASKHHSFQSISKKATSATEAATPVPALATLNNAVVIISTHLSAHFGSTAAAATWATVDGVGTGGVRPTGELRAGVVFVYG